MTKQIDQSVLDKVKKHLQIGNDLSSIELLHLLRDHRKRIHPDKFTEEAAKKEAEEKFKYTGQLIDELDRFVQMEKLSRSATEIALFEPLYDNMALQKDLDDAREKISSLEYDIASLKKDNDELQKLNTEKQNTELEKEAKELRDYYRPSGQKLASLGILFFLTLGSTIMMKVEGIYNIIVKYSPINEQYLNTILFSTFIVILLLVIKQYFESKYITRRSVEVCSPVTCKEFSKYIDRMTENKPDQQKTFTESLAFDFIHGKRTGWKNILAFFGFKMFQIETHDRLKNYFINTLLNKKLIKMHHAKDLDRVFVIRNGQGSYWNEF